MSVPSYELIQETNRYIDTHREMFAELGQRFFDEFGYDTGTNRIKTQIRNLQQITCSAACFADIEDFVKNQMGRERMAKQTPWKALGHEVLRQLAQLRAHSEKFEADIDSQMALRLRLARGWGRAVVSEYLYQVACAQMGETT